jgi:hypothetical protein
MRETLILRELHVAEYYGVDGRLTAYGWTSPIPPKEVDITDNVRDRDGLRFFYLLVGGEDPVIVRAHIGERLVMRSTCTGRTVTLEWYRITP